MARFWGLVGIDKGESLVDGVFQNELEERSYYGDVLKDLISSSPGDKVNDDIRLQHRISIVADDFAIQNMGRIKYVEWAGSLWMVNSIEHQRPRLILSVGGVYNGKRAPRDVQSDPIEDHE